MASQPMDLESDGNGAVDAVAVVNPRGTRVIVHRTRVVADRTGMVVRRCMTVINGATIVDMFVVVMTAVAVFVPVALIAMVAMIVVAVAVAGLRTKRRDADDQAGSEGTELVHESSPGSFGIR